MANWSKVKISDFLTEREGRFKPNDVRLNGFKRLDKIDFSGQIVLSEKSSKTDMIIINPGDLVISGINVSKGALAVFNGEKPITATIHYSSYSFDNEKIDINYFKHFVKSQAFTQILKNQVKGGIKTEIKSKHFLPLELSLPDIASQKEIASFFEEIESKIGKIDKNNNKQLFFLNKLRQSILQDAIEGKLTAKWRKENPELISGEKHALKLLAKIKLEKEQLIRDGKIKREKPLAPITEEEKPFDLPSGWAWCRLGDIIIYTENLDIQSRLKADTIINYVDIDAIDNVNYKIRDIKHKKVSELSSRARRILKKGFILFSTVRPYLNNIALIEENIDNLIGSTGFTVFKTIKIDLRYIFHLILSPYVNELYKELMGGFNSPSITKQQFENTLIPIPPLLEQQAIVEQIGKYLVILNELEKQVAERKELSGKLLQAVLREAFATN